MNDTLKENHIYCDLSCDTIIWSEISSFGLHFVLKVQIFLSRLNGPPLGLTAAKLVVVDTSLLLTVSWLYNK